MDVEPSSQYINVPVAAPYQGYTFVKDKVYSAIYLRIYGARFWLITNGD